MSLKLLSLTIGLIASVWASHPFSDSHQCPEIKLTISVEKTDIELSAIATAEGAEKPVYYIFYYPSGQLVDKDRDVTKNKISNLKKGSYVCSISDKNGCTAKTEFKVD